MGKLSTVYLFDIDRSVKIATWFTSIEKEFLLEVAVAKALVIEAGIIKWSSKTLFLFWNVIQHAFRNSLPHRPRFHALLWHTKQVTVTIFAMYAMRQVKKECFFNAGESWNMPKRIVQCTILMTYFKNSIEQLKEAYIHSFLVKLLRVCHLTHLCSQRSPF